MSSANQLEPITPEPQTVPGTYIKRVTTEAKKYTERVSIISFITTTPYIE